MLLTNHVAIVTGAGRGLGRAVALALAAQGASVVLASRNAPQLDEAVKHIRRAGGHALAQTADVADERQVQELVLAAEQWVGPATILINSASIVDPIGPLARSDAAAWLRSVAINIGGPYLVTRAVLPGMLARAYGRIVTVSSAAATQPRAEWTAYGAANAAVVQLTRNLALELEGTGVTACAFDPGLIDLDLEERARKLASVDSPASAITYLASPLASPNGVVVAMGDPELARSVAEALA